MSALLVFSAEHPVLAFIAMLCLTSVALAAIRTIFFLLPNRILRTIRVAARGWPPPHCDADGDFKP